MSGRRSTLLFTISKFVKLFMRIQPYENHAMFVYPSLQIDLVLNKLIMDSGRRSGG